MAENTMTVKGIGAEIDLLGDRIKIRRKGVSSFLTHGVKGDKEILISQISSVQFKKAGMTSGYIQFGFLGGTESKGGIMAGAKDENTVMFKRGQQRGFEVLKERIEGIQREPTATPSHQPASSNLDELQKLADLKDRGIVTEQEFEEKKRQLLGL